MGLFRKKKVEVSVPEPVKPKKMDMGNVKLKLNIRAMCLFEEISSKSVMDIADEMDVFQMLYACLVTNNEEWSNMSFDVFTLACQNEKLVKALIKEYTKIEGYLKQFRIATAKEGEEHEDEGASMKISDAAYTLIAKLGIDPHYVMYEMELWEFKHYFEVYEQMQKDELIDKRLWTYIQISPHIDHKKCKSPEKMLPFPWEKEGKKEKERDLEKNKAGIMGFLSKQKKKDGEGGPDNNTGTEGC